MKLYREVKREDSAKGIQGEIRLVLPIEITEEEIVKIFRKHSFTSDAGWVLISANDFEETAEAILSKLKGE